MRSFTLCLAVALLPGGSGCAGSPSGPATTAAGSSTPATVPGEYILTLAPGIEVGAVTQVFGRFGIKRTQNMGDGLVLVALQEDPGLARMKELQAQDPRLKAVQPNYVYQAF